MKIGLTSLAHTHALSYATYLKSLPGVEVRCTDPGPYGPGEVRGETLAAQLGIAYEPSLERLLAWGPDAAVVTSENSRHREHVQAAAAAGVHVLCEKPLATTWEDGLAIRDAVGAAGVIGMVAFPVRFASAFQRLRAEYQAGTLGQLYAIRGANNGQLPLGRSWFADPALAGGGALMDHVVHLADLIDALTGLAPLRVNAASNRVLHADRAKAETAGLVTVEYAGGLIAGLDCSWSMADRSPVWGGLRLVVTGTGGTADVDFFEPAVRGLDATTGRPLTLRYGPDFDAAMLETFLAAVRTGRQPQPDLNVGLRTLSIVLAAQRSAREGRTVAVEEITTARP
jgi:predicted dehydrogenase